MKNYVILKTKNNNFFNKNNKIMIQKRKNSITIIFSNDHFKTSNFKTQKVFLYKVKKFIDLLNNELNHVNPKYFYKNFKKYYFDINNIDIYKTNIELGVVYQSRKNKDKKFVIKNSCCIGHELFHLATIRNFGSKNYCGFRVYNQFNELDSGLGLNEIYTELLAIRYFKNNRNFPFMQKIILVLENLIGRQKMEKLYFDSNLNKLIEELKIYTKEDKINQFLEEIDWIYNNILYNENNDLDEQIKSLENHLIKICNFLFECFKEKSKYCNNSIELIEDMKLLYDKFTINYKNKKIYINLLNKQKQSEFYNYVNTTDIKKYI